MTPSSVKNIELAAHFATVAAALVAAVTLIIGGCQFTKTQETARRNIELQMATLKNDREMKARELFLKFNEQKEELAGKAPPRKGEAAYWRANALLATTEAVFILTRGDEGWRKTVSWMLKEQNKFLVQTDFYCGTFAEDFLVLMRNEAPDLKCMAHD
jgi:hypothetical protein